MKKLLSSILVCISCFVLGCNDGTFHACDEDSDCSEGMVCPGSGVSTGRCAFPCDLSTLEVCAEELGDDGFCHVDYVCALRCSSDGDCPGGFSCDTSGSPDHCSAE